MDYQLSSFFFSYDENSHEGKFDEDELMSPPATDSKFLLSIFLFIQLNFQGLDVDNVDEEDDGTFEVNFFSESFSSSTSFQGVPLSEIINTWKQPPILIDMKDIQDRNHTLLIKV